MPGAHGAFGDIARRRRPARIGVEAAAIEVLGRFAIQLHRLLARLRHADELQEAGAIRIAVLAQARHLGPEPVHRRLAVLVAEIRQVGVDVVHPRAPLPGLDRAAAGDPHRRMRTLHRTRPDVHVALLVEAAVEREGVRRPARPSSPGHAPPDSARAAGSGSGHSSSRCPSACRPGSRRSAARPRCSRSSRILPPRASADCTARANCPSRRSPCRASAARSPRRSGWATASGRSRWNGARCSTRRRSRNRPRTPSRP